MRGTTTAGQLTEYRPQAWQTDPATAQPRTLRIANDGAPLSAEVSQQLFTPFFGTKAGGQGIGLTLVRDVLLAHRFAFRLETEADGRTVFSVALAPAAA